MADDTSWQDFSERVCVDALLRVAVTPRPAGASAEGLGERNLATLQSIAALEERRADSADEDNPVLQELARLDAKLNALLDIVNRLLLPGGALPVRQPVKVNAVGAVLPGALVPAATDGICVRLHLDACPSLPLELPARVQRRLDDGNAFVVFEQLGDAVADALERLVFRLHRRKVAEARHSVT